MATDLKTSQTPGHSTIESIALTELVQAHPPALVRDHVIVFPLIDAGPLATVHVIVASPEDAKPVAVILLQFAVVLGAEMSAVEFTSTPWSKAIWTSRFSMLISENPAVSLALAEYLRNKGMAMADMIPKIATTIINSISVKALEDFITRHH
ncbi:hypothetical protein [Pseudomonas sp. CFBP 13602]|uniref:hypothetical protein n=1 Tax=unclassified Pseudomonas TaxID=196821 RepID=UPI00406C3111